MKKPEAKIDIAAAPKEVWDKMIQRDTYREWVNVAWPGSYYEGTWGPGENVRFLSPGRGGTLAKIIEYRPYDYIVARHIAVINADGSEDRESEAAKNWIGTIESYTFRKHDGKSELITEMNTDPEWEKMFTDSMPKALAKLKEICGNHTPRSLSGILFGYLPLAICIFGVAKPVTHLVDFNAIFCEVSFFIDPHSVIFPR